MQFLKDEIDSATKILSKQWYTHTYDDQAKRGLVHAGIQGMKHAINELVEIQSKNNIMRYEMDALKDKVEFWALDNETPRHLKTALMELIQGK